MEFGVKKYKKNLGEKYVPIGNFVHWYIQSNKISKAQLARDLDILPTTLNQYFKQDSLQYAVLWKISKALNYNFLASLAEYLHIPFETIKMKEMQKEIDDKNKIIEKLELQIAAYKEVLKR